MITIRALRAEDFMPWLALWQGYQRFYQTTIDDNTTGESFRRLLSRAEPMHCLVAEQDGAMVGLVHFLTHRSTWDSGRLLLFAGPLRQRSRARSGRWQGTDSGGL